MLRKRPFLLLTGIALFLSACLLLAGHILSQPDEPVTIATVEYGQKYWGTGISYTRIIELQHSGEHNGTLITTYECATSGLRKEKPGYNIHVSRDGGSGWEFVTTVRDQTPGLQSEFNPFLYELPQPVGDMPAGTLLLAGLSIDAAHDTSTVIQLYRSHDAGRTWALYTSVAEGSGIGAGIWEPWLMVLPDGRLACYYSDGTEWKNHSQKLVMKISEDGLHWGEAINVVALEDRLLRPGMITIARMNNSCFLMTYEICNEANPDSGNAVHYRFSQDGIHWGDVTDPGTRLVTGDGAVPGSAPYVAYVPGYGTDGLLLVTSVFQTPAQSRGNIVYVNDRLGDPCAWRAWFLPHEYANSIGGYSHAVFAAQDGLTAYFVNNIPDPAAAEEGYTKMILSRYRFDASFIMPE